MSNRILGVLIILGFIGAGYIYYHMIYIPEQYNKMKAQNEWEQAMENSKTKARFVEQKGGGDPKTISNLDKIQQIKEKNKSYFYTSLSEIGNFRFMQKRQSLELFLNNNSLGLFPKVNPQEIQIQKVFNTSEYIFCILGKKKILYDLTHKIITNIPLDIKVEYVKKGRNTSEFLFKTSVGVFVYNFIDQKMVYNHFFTDFVYWMDPSIGKYGFIGIVHQSEDQKLKNLGFQDIENFKSLVILYHPTTKEKTIILRSNFHINTIYTVEKNNEVMVFVSDVSGKIYQIENI